MIIVTFQPLKINKDAVPDSLLKKAQTGPDFPLKKTQIGLRSMDFSKKPCYH